MIKSGLHNCFVKTRDGDFIYTSVDAVVTTRIGKVVHDGPLLVLNLDGYAIVPRDEWYQIQAEYERLKEMVSKGVSPANNDGRSSCWWCGGTTEKKQGFSRMYDICPKCGK